MTDNQSGESYQEWKERAKRAENQMKELQDQNQILLKEMSDIEF